MTELAVACLVFSIFIFILTKLYVELLWEIKKLKQIRKPAAPETLEFNGSHPWDSPVEVPRNEIILKLMEVTGLEIKTIKTPLTRYTIEKKNESR